MDSGALLFVPIVVVLGVQAALGYPFRAAVYAASLGLIPSFILFAGFYEFVNGGNPLTLAVGFGISWSLATIVLGRPVLDRLTTRTADILVGAGAALGFFQRHSPFI